jgi:hypothetical protein
MKGFQLSEGFATDMTVPAETLGIRLSVVRIMPAL